MRCFALLAALSFLVTAAGEAQVARVQFGGGLSTPSGDLGKGQRLGFHVRASIGLSFPVSPISVRADGELHRFPDTFTTDNYNILAGSLNATFNVLGLGMLGTGGRLYAVGGLGYYSLAPSLRVTTKNVGAQGGLGVTIGALGFGGMVEVRFVNVFKSSGDDRFIPITVGLKF